MVNLRLFPDQSLINRIKRNDRTVMTEIFTRYRRMVASYVGSHGGDETDTEDMLQEAIVVLWQKVCRGNFELTSKLGTYLLGIVKNKWNVELRKRRRISKEVSEETVDGNPSSLEKVIQAEMYESVRCAIEELQPICREILLLFYFEGRSFEDIARILGFAGADVAKSRKYQCKKALEEILKKRISRSERSD